MWLYEILRNFKFEGLGTELGLFNLAVLSILSTALAWIVKQKRKEVRKLLAEHRDLWKEHTELQNYRERKDASQKKISYSDVRALIVEELLNSKRE